jgi:hypothetical protein
MKRPSFQFYPSDWLRDTALRTCSTGARGLWMDMICFMHEGNPYGYLKVGNKVILSKDLARMVGEDLRLVEEWLNELKEAGVYDIDDGAICSRRMIRDENLRKIRAEGGKLGGNPKLKDNHKDNLEDKQKTTPSSSSSSSSTNISIEVAKAPKAKRLSLEELPKEWEEFCKTERKDLNPIEVFNQFRDYWIAQGGQKGAKLDWFATWRNWVRNQRSQNIVSKQMDDKSWMFSNQGIEAKAKELGVNDYGIQNHQQLKDKILLVMAKKAMQ